MYISAIGFLISLVAILILARRNLAFALFAGAVILGLFTMPPRLIFHRVLITIIDPSIIILALVVALIPMIGGMMKDSGQMDDLVNNLRIGRKGIMAVAPALMGLLPMPGGALFSAPVLERSGEGIPDDLKVSINNWFRHILILIYPLSSDLISTVKISGLSMYRAIVYLLPTCVLATILGYVFLIRKIPGELKYPEPFSLKKLLVPFIIILAAPTIDIVLKIVLSLPIKEIATLVGVVTALVLAWSLSPSQLDIRKIGQRMKPWNFSLIIINMFIFLNIFKTSNIDRLITAIPLPVASLCVVAGFILAIATGRVLLPASIIFPVYLSTAAISPLSFVLIYTAVFFGYVISPVHPCVCVTCEYFKVTVKDVVKLLAPPTLVIITLTVLISLISR